MSDSIIKVEGLSKKYIIGHQKAERYTALRDVLADNVKGLFRKTRDLVKGNYTVEGDIEEEFWALQDINFEIKQGDRLGIIGRNGAGKSTLLKILSRITEPTKGRVTINGRVASLLEVGTGFHPELTGRENVYLNGAILGMSRAEIKRKFDEIVAFAEVEKFLDTPVKRYSSGMYVRLAFAVAAHLEPEILIVDEVLAVGDAQFQRKCLGKMEDVSKNEGRTVLFVSHNMNVIKNICSSAVLFSKGKLIESGSCNSVVEKYLENDESYKLEKRSYFHKEKSDFASITNIDINEGKSSLVSVFETLHVDITVEVSDKAHGYFEFFILIYNTEGVPVFGSFQKDSDAFFEVSDSLKKVRVSFENNLIPGRYFISAGIFDSSRNFIDWVEFAEKFEVEHSYADGRLFEARLGLTVQKANWSKVL